MINLSTKFEVSVFTHYEDTKGNAKCRNWDGFGRLETMHFVPSSSYSALFENITRVRLFSNNSVCITFTVVEWQRENTIKLMNVSVAEKSTRRTGRCKWFNVVKGYGFITPDDGQPDVFLHQVR